MSKKTIGYINLFVFCCSVIIIFFICEIAIRTYHLLHRNIPFHVSPVNYRQDFELGWSGKQIFGDPTTQKYKIFIVGDSVTEGYGLKEKSLYYSVIKKNLDAEIFVYGGIGYGTTQEYILIDRYLDQIKPDLVLLQTCSNDFFNNCLELERTSFSHNSLKARPYLIAGKIEYRFPGLLGSWKTLSSFSRFIYFLLIRIERLFAYLAEKNILYSIDKDIEKGNMPDSFKKAIVTTDILIAKIKNRVGKTPIIAFAIEDKEPYFTYFKRIFKKNNIKFIEDAPEIIREIESTGIAMRLKNGHPNEIANQLCGEVLTNALEIHKSIIIPNE